MPPAKKATENRKTRTPKENPVSAETVETPKRRGGRKPDPMTALTHRFTKAKRELVKAQEAAEKVKAVAERLEAAQREYAEAAQALQDAINELPVGTPDES